MDILATLTNICADLALPAQVGHFSTLPNPPFAVLTPFLDEPALDADNRPQALIEHVRISIYTATNYLDLRTQLVSRLLDAGLLISDGRYVAFEPDTGLHHYSLDVCTYQPL